MHAKRSSNHRCQARGDREPEVTECVAVVATHRLEDHLADAVRRNMATVGPDGNQEGTSGPTTDPPRRCAGSVDSRAKSDVIALRETSNGWRLGAIASHEPSKRPSLSHRIVSTAMQQATFAAYMVSLLYSWWILAQPSQLSINTRSKSC